MVARTPGGTITAAALRRAERMTALACRANDDSTACRANDGSVACRINGVTLLEAMAETGHSFDDGRWSAPTIAQTPGYTTTAAALWRAEPTTTLRRGPPRGYRRNR